MLRAHSPLRPMTRMWIRRAATSASSSCWVGAGRGAEARFPTPPAEPCMPLSRHTALPLSVILSLDRVMLEAETLLHFTDVHRYVPLRVRSATFALAFPTDCRPSLPEVIPRFLATMAAPTPVEGIDGPFTLASLDGPPTFMLVDSNGVV